MQIPIPEVKTMTQQLITFRHSWDPKSEIGNHGNECESTKMYMSR